MKKKGGGDISLFGRKERRFSTKFYQSNDDDDDVYPQNRVSSFTSHNSSRACNPMKSGYQREFVITVEQTRANINALTKEDEEEVLRNIVKT